VDEAGSDLGAALDSDFDFDDSEFDDSDFDDDSDADNDDVFARLSVR